MSTDEQVLGRHAKQFLTRSKKQQLQKLLEELEIQSGETRGSDENEVLLAIKSAVQQDLDSTQLVAEALIDTELLEVQLQKAIQERTEKYIADNSTRLASEINQKIDAMRTELESVKGTKSKLEAEIARDKAAAKRELDDELRSRRTRFEAELVIERETLNKQSEELNRQKEVLKNNLVEVGKKLSEQRDEVVNSFLTISPLLASIEIGATIANELPIVLVNEMQQYGVDIHSPESDVEYGLWIGDLPASQSTSSDNQPSSLVAVLFSGLQKAVWRDAYYFEGCRGRVSIIVRSRAVGSERWEDRALTHNFKAWVLSDGQLPA